MDKAFKPGVVEVKFPLMAAQIVPVMEWTRSNLEPDSHGTGLRRDAYLVQPTAIRQLIEHLGLGAGPLSKYRLGVRACGLVADTTISDGMKGQAAVHV
jgi:hypothetical protein